MASLGMSGGCGQVGEEEMVSSERRGEESARDLEGGEEE